MFKRLSIMAIFATTVGAAYATPAGEANYEYVGPKRPRATTRASATIPPPTVWVPPHRIPHPFTRKPEERLQPSAGITTSFSIPTFTVPTFSTPSFTSPTFTLPTYTAPTFTVPTYTSPSYSAPTFTTPSFTVPTFTTPTFTNPGF